jgi:hypothetical protein
MPPAMSVPSAREEGDRDQWVMLSALQPDALEPRVLGVRLLIGCRTLDARAWTKV